MKSLCTLFVLAAAALAIGCQRVSYEWQGPSDNFIDLDANADGDIDRLEWEVAQGSVFSRSHRFRAADCDSDGRLSWHEYFEGYMSSRLCPDGYLYSPPPPPAPEGGAMIAIAYSSGDRPDNRTQGTLLVRPDESLQIYEQMPAGPDVPTLLKPRWHALPARYSEADLPTRALRRLRFTSSRLADAELVAHYDPIERVPGNEARGMYPHLTCDIANDNLDIRITMADIEVVWESDGEESRERWLKPVWVDPGRVQRLDVWFAARVQAAECRLLNARGQVVARR